MVRYCYKLLKRLGWSENLICNWIEVQKLVLPKSGPGRPFVYAEIVWEDHLCVYNLYGRTLSVSSIPPSTARTIHSNPIGSMDHLCIVTDGPTT